jgi:hypothetical protein
MRSLASIAVAALLAVALVAAYVAAGGRSYHPTPVADPCAQRVWRAPSGVEETLEQVALSTADGAACELHVSREDVVLALASSDDLSRFARKYGISDDNAQDAVRAGLVRAVDDAERADAIDGGLADVLRGVARHLPIAVVLDVLHGASRLLPG